MDFDPFASLAPDKDSISSDLITNENTTDRIDPFSWNEPSVGGENDADGVKLDSFTLSNTETANDEEENVSSGMLETLGNNQQEIPDTVPTISIQNADSFQAPSLSSTEKKVRQVYNML